MVQKDYNVIKFAHIEQLCKTQFNIDIRVENVIVDDVQTGPNSYATVFQVDQHTLYVLCESDDPMTLSDVKHIVKSMGVEAAAYLAPRADSEYFARYGHEAFLRAYPGRKTETDQEKSYYQTLSPYTPALIKVAKINGEIRRYNSVVSNWQKVLDYSYARMRVQ